MARIHGRFGQLYVGATSTGSASPVAATKSWTLDSATDFVDATAQGDTSKQNLAGLPGGTGSFEAFYSDSEYTGNIFASSTTGTAVKIYAYPNRADTAKYWFFTGFISGSVTSSVDGATTVSGKFAAATDVIAVGIS